MNAKVFLSALLLISASAVAQQAAPTVSADPKGVNVTVDLTGSPLTGTCPYNINLSWTAVNASVCNKTGAWAGSGSASGSESQQVNGSVTYTLTCSSDTESKTLSWTNPTQNTDGTNAVLTGSKVYHANSAANIEANPPVVLTPAKVTYVVAGLPAGPRVFGVKATGTGGLDSAISLLPRLLLSCLRERIQFRLPARHRPSRSHRRRSLSPPQYGKQFTTIRGESWSRRGRDCPE